MKEERAAEDFVRGLTFDMVHVETVMGCGRMCRQERCHTFLYDEKLGACHIITNSTVLPYISDSAEVFTRTLCDD